MTNFTFNKLNVISVLFGVRPQFIKDSRSAFRNYNEEAKAGSIGCLPNIEIVQKRVDLWVNEMNFDVNKLNEKEIELLDNLEVRSGVVNYKSFMTRDEFLKLRTKFLKLNNYE